MFVNTAEHELQQAGNLKANQMTLIPQIVMQAEKANQLQCGGGVS